MSKLARCALAAAAYFALSAATHSQQTPPARLDFLLESQPLADAVTAWAQQAGLQLIWPTGTSATSSQIAPRIKGRFAPEEALGLLLQGSGLTYSFIDRQTVAIRATATLTTSRNESMRHEALRVAASETIESDRAALSAADAQRKSRDHKGDPRESTAEVADSEVIVTGSRLRRASVDGPQEVRVYTREQIDQSGQTSVSDFLSTISNASVNSSEAAALFFTPLGTTTVQLRGLPLGTTLVLLNGRRVESSGVSDKRDYFDLNSIPMAAVDRIEIIADGSSAIYGSDAIAGVVNIVLKQDFNGFEGRVRYGAASGMGDTVGSLAWGRRWDKGSLTLVGSYQKRSELDASERSITANADYRSFGGPNANTPVCNPGNVFSTDGSNLPGLNAPFAAVPAGLTRAPSIGDFQRTAGTLNECNLRGDTSLIPATERSGALVEGHFELSPSLDLFTFLMYSRVKQESYLASNFLFGIESFQDYTVSPANPYNPFGTRVGVSELLTSIQRQGQFLDTRFRHGVVGVRGALGSRWDYELSARGSKDTSDNLNLAKVANRTAIQSALDSSDPGSALNPFVPGAPGPQSQLDAFYSDLTNRYSGHEYGLNGFIRGDLWHLPSGTIELVVGSEYDRSGQTSEVATPTSTTHVSADRNAYALFAEAKIPVLANPENPRGPERLGVSIAGRYDHYSDFGNTTNPQIGVQWRPFRSILVRGSYSGAFKAPALATLYAPQSTGQTQIVDPLTGQRYQTTYVRGGNPDLDALTGDSSSFGFVYANERDLGTRFSVTHWNVTEDNAVVALNQQVIVDNADLFPDRVTRAAASGGQPGRITKIDITSTNFGKFEVAGLDYGLSYRWTNPFGTWTPAVNASQTYHYTGELVPGAPSVNRAGKANLDGAFAPRWKGNVALTWNRGPLTSYVAGRYVGHYRDYQALDDGTYKQLGNFWYVDANFRYEPGEALGWKSDWLSGIAVEIGGINVFNKLPEYSNYGSGFAGYDGTQADIRGRLVYAQIGTRF